jgi:hypothetical protein
LSLQAYFVLVVQAAKRSSVVAPTSLLQLSPDSYIRILQPPARLQHNFPLLVEFFSRNASVVVGVDVRVWTETQDGAIVYRNRNAMNASTFKTGSTNRLTIRLRLPRYLAYRPDRTNKYSVFVDRASVQLWMLSPAMYRNASLSHRDFYDVANTTRDRVDVGIAAPYERPERPCPVDQSPTWWTAVRNKLPYRPVCPLEIRTYVRGVYNGLAQVCRLNWQFNEESLHERGCSCAASMCYSNV